MDTKIKLEILYQDDYCIAINKPNGLLVHRTHMDAQETLFAMQLLRDQIGGQHVYPIHRLDKATSGLLLFGLNKEIASHLNEQFRERQVKKTYLAITRGYAPENGTIEKPLPKSEGKPPVPSKTDFKRLATIELPLAVGRYPTARYSLVEAYPYTGRWRQIRLHLRHLRHPIIGDKRRGDRDHNAFFKSHFDCDSLLLHSQSLTFQHPIYKKEMTVHAPLIGDFKRMIELFKVDF